MKKSKQRSRVSKAGPKARKTSRPTPPGRRRQLAGNLTRDLERQAQVALMQEMVARAYKIPLAELRAPTRRRAAVAQARQVAMYLTHVGFGMPLACVGRYFGRDRTTAAYACRRVEDRRDDRQFDHLLDRLELVVRLATRAHRGTASDGGFQ